MKAARKTSSVHARIEPTEKRKAEKILSHVGLNMSDAISLFIRQVNIHKGLPFELHIPNAETRKAIEESRRGEGKTFKNVDELFEDLGI